MKRAWDSSQAQQLFTKLQQSQKAGSVDSSSSNNNSNNNNNGNNNNNNSNNTGSSNSNSNTANANSSANTKPESSHWLDMSNHPYASAYSNVSSTSLLPGGSYNGTTGGSNDTKRPRSNKDEEDSDDDDDDDDSDEDGQAQKLAAQAAKPNRKIVKGADGKPKVKLTRGSRACIA